MTHKKTIGILISAIAIVGIIATSIGIFFDGNSGDQIIASTGIATETVQEQELHHQSYNKLLLHRNAQDLVTLFIAIPLLIISYLYTFKGSLAGRLTLAGTLAYLMVTYLMYLIMGMYNYLFLLYAFLLSSSFFAFTFTLLSFDIRRTAFAFTAKAPAIFSGAFLLSNTLIIGLIWFGIAISPFLRSTFYPSSLEPYATLAIQGLDLGLLLPIGFISGYWLLRKKAAGYLLGTVYLVFLSLLMAALLAKISYMWLEGYNIIPAIYLIPVIMVISATCSILLLKHLR